MQYPNTTHKKSHVNKRHTEQFILPKHIS